MQELALIPDCLPRLLYSYTEAAELLGLSSVQALRDLVYKGRGPRGVNMGRRVMFRADDLEVFVEGLRSDQPPLPPPAPSTTLVRRRHPGRPSVRERQAEMGLR